MTEELFIEKEFSKLDFFTDRIVKVHGAQHPELSDVRELFVRIKAKTEEDPCANVSSELAQLAEVTHGYEVPADACEGYRTTYDLLRSFHDLSRKKDAFPASQINHQ